GSMEDIDTITLPSHGLIYLDVFVGDILLLYSLHNAPNHVGAMSGAFLKTIISGRIISYKYVIKTTSIKLLSGAFWGLILRYIFLLGQANQQPHSLIVDIIEEASIIKSTEHTIEGASDDEEVTL
ncbi:hypothetical protein ACJX0J_022199, partial [Zea mays]